MKIHNTAFLLSAIIPVLCAVNVPNPVFWERSFVMNISNENSIGTLIQSTSNMATSQDFQGIHLDPNPRNAPDRIVFNFDEGCPSSNITMDTIQQLNFDSIQAAPIRDAQKIALVKRGNCKWSEKIDTVNHLALANNINITAIFIYDNEPHGSNVTIQRKAVVGSGSIGPPSYPDPLPASRSILNMSDNDLDLTSPSTTTVYFLPFIYGNTFVDRINSSYNASNPALRVFWLVTPYLEEVSWGYVYSDGFFATGRGYLSYIIALAAIFILGVIFLRWWRVRRLRGDYANGSGNGFQLQPRPNQVDPLPVDIVNSLPIDKYSEGLIKNVNCAICLEDFVPNKNDIRILPCGHGFCVLCIDPWLTQKSTMCPICKWDCLPAELRRERDAQNAQNFRREQNQSASQVENSGSNSSTSDSTVINMDVSESHRQENQGSTVQHAESQSQEINHQNIAQTMTPPTPPPSSPTMNQHNEAPLSANNAEIKYSKVATDVPSRYSTNCSIDEKQSSNPFESQPTSGSSSSQHVPFTKERSSIDEKKSSRN
ncbi:hypothetical protein BDF20DRAFT_881522 [Mycotypha africana]|uniref:uncharacterized protein n=1 Tax=Mycotypha africana TaxID=64632 RepID=UPI002301A44B|nr:uncharacterized protein BDF20DRAFT_881522 [Mycotypha africana]KAI8973282.1 hypothetical protein BDF20DRAFT_881522 [Mycotypha africana]